MFRGRSQRTRTATGIIIVNEDFEPIPPEFNAHGPALEDDVRALNARYPGIPLTYLDFLRKNDGGDGWFPTGRYFRFWRASEIESDNEAYGIPEFSPDFVLFGSDGGGEAYAFDTREHPWVVGELPFVGISGTDFIRLGTFDEFWTKAWAAPGGTEK
jgi:hypothetical protein